MYTLNGWCFLSSGGAYPPVFTVDTIQREYDKGQNELDNHVIF